MGQIKVWVKLCNPMLVMRIINANKNLIVSGNVRDYSDWQGVFVNVEEWVGKA
ncbi:hypothetical protein GCM10010913_14680 [Paenibacillus aceti]|uniref:Uncharacterized protein n=1 Tax=Paenibacillus aceti TaxID=1820010 RepID=A0ABQ1VS25_9BACL|nr:hypothetical protein GCM10010913_14680 [Paenibacillus aceti]